MWKINFTTLSDGDVHNINMYIIPILPYCGSISAAVGYSNNGSYNQVRSQWQGRSYVEAEEAVASPVFAGLMNIMIK